MIATTPISSTSLEEVKAMGIDTRIIAERDERHFCTCGVCKQKSTVDFHIVVWEFAFQSPRVGIAWEPRVSTFKDGKEVRNTYIAACPLCGAAKPARAMLKKTSFKAGHVCDDRCQCAVSEICICSCGGKNHGIKNKR